MRVAILIPVYNDWDCLPRLLNEIDAVLAGNLSATVVIVNDGGASAPKDAPFLQRYARIGDIRIVELVRNVGSQIAVSIGLALISDQVSCDCVVVMDADGQDRPAHILDLLAAHRANPAHLVTAERSGRAEGALFRVCYQIYRFVFWTLTGQRIGFGNFSLIPRQHLARLSGMAELPFHVAACLLKSRLPIVRVPCYRDPRYDGVTSQSFVTLVIHAINALSVFSEVVLVRISLGAAIMIGLGIMAILVISAIRVASNVWIMGYATTAIGLLILAMGQALVLSLIGIFVRAQRPLSIVVEPQQYRASIARIEISADQQPLREVP